MGASPLKAVSTDLGRRVAAHALNRLGYGPRPGDVDAVLAQGVEQWVEEQLAPAGDPDLDGRLAGFRTLGYSVSQVLALYNADQRTLTTILDEFNSAKMIRAVHGRKPAPGGARRLLVQPLQRRHLRRLRALQRAGL